MTDGPTTNSWVGKFFTPVAGYRYFVPDNAANYPRLRGKCGNCIGSRSTFFGHSFALIKFDDIDDPRWVRTNYLLPDNGAPKHPVTEDEPSFSVVERFENVWKDDNKHHRTEKLKGY